MTSKHNQNVIPRENWLIFNNNQQNFIQDFKISLPPLYTHHLLHKKRELPVNLI